MFFKKILKIFKKISLLDQKLEHCPAKILQCFLYLLHNCAHLIHLSNIFLILKTMNLEDISKHLSFIIS